MADNIPVTAGSGTNLATDEIGGVHYQRTKLTFGPDGTATDVSDADPLPCTFADALTVDVEFPASMAVTAASLPLPTGAATEATLAAVSTKTPALGQALMASSSPVVIASNQSAVPVSLTSTTITGTVAATQSGTWNIGSITTLPALVAGTALIGKVGLDQTTPGTTNAISIGQIGSTTVATGNGVVGAGVQRVAIASDNTAFSVNAVQSGTWNIGSITTLPALPANQSVNVAQMNGVTVTMGSGVTGTGVQRVVLATDVALPTGSNVIGALTANQSVNIAQMNGVAVTMGSGVTGTGVQRVVLATDVALPTGANVIGALTANQSVNNAQVAGVATATGNGVVGTGVQRVAIASDNTAFSVNATGPTLTKGTQAATGFSTQDLKDAGRVSACAATVIGGVTAVTSEALLSLVVVRDGVAAGGATTITVTSGKRFRVQGIVAGVRSSAATVLSGRVALRMNPSGAVTASSPILAILSMTQQAAALAEAGDTCVMAVPDGIEFSGTMQFGLSQVCSGTGGVVYASIIGYEY